MNMTCPICGSDRLLMFAKRTVKNSSEIVYGYKWTPAVRKTLELQQCKQCKHVGVTNLDFSIASEYSDVADEVYLENSDLRTSTSKSVLRVLHKYVSGGKVLDVGCGTGEFLAVASSEFEPHGIELSSWAAKISRKNVSAVSPVFFSNIFEKEISAYPEVNFDLVTMWGVIEHLQHPEAVVKDINLRMNQGGILALWTGDAGSFFARLFKSRWWYVIGQHINLFSKKSLKILLERNGFQLLSYQIYPYTMRLGYLSQSLNRYPVLKFFSLILQIPLLREIRIKLYLPGEMFAIYKKL